MGRDDERLMLPIIKQLSLLLFLLLGHSLLLKKKSLRPVTIKNAVVFFSMVVLTYYVLSNSSIVSESFCSLLFLYTYVIADKINFILFLLVPVSIFAKLIRFVWKGEK
jgi:hypothetical protein